MENFKMQAFRNSILNLTVLTLAVFVMTGCAAKSKNVLLTGYWPPTNEMLRPFSDNCDQNTVEWIGKNYLNSGYDVYAYFPEFPGGTAKNPKGDGDFEVDYQDTLADFQRITNKLKPEFIISYGKGDGPWEIEVNSHWRTKWFGDYLPPRQPEPADGNVKTLHTTLPVEKIKKQVQSALPDLKVWIDYKGDPGTFLCSYLAYLVMEYQSKNEHCKGAGFIHVGESVDQQTAIKANKAVLKAVLKK
jgi:pyrrolidone-carboxylate peptidase